MFYTTHDNSHGLPHDPFKVTGMYATQRPRWKP